MMPWPTRPPQNRCLLAREPEEKKMATQIDNSMKVKVILAWGFVGIPLAWGVIETISNALKLFQ